MKATGHKGRGLEGLFRDECGFTTVSMALSLLISLALIFTTAQVYRINSASAEVQDVADAAALCAENQVGEFMVVARFCDAVVLSLSLTGIVVTGLGVAALCVPATASLSEGLLEAGQKVMKVRDKFSKRAAKALNKLQEALPYLSAACAASLASANNADSKGSRYVAVAVLVPAKGEKLKAAADPEAEKLLDDIDEQADEIRQKAEEAERAAEEANNAKQRAFARDCGDNPQYCMYERALSLAEMTGADNPLYSSIDTWSFSVPLERARAYYNARLSREAPADNSVAEQAKSVMRSHFYQYAVNQMNSGFVNESPDFFMAYFPRLPHNTDEMRQTSLYTDAIYPVTEVEVEVEKASDAGSESEGEAGEGSDEEAEAEEPEVTTKTVMHVWDGCPEAAGSSSTGSIQDMETGEYETCPTCGFTAASMGKVAAASSSISNGFEYHYEAVADEAAIYEEERKKADAPKSEVQEEAGSLLDRLGELLKSTLDKRIDPEPPGRIGAIAFAVNIGTVFADEGVASEFVAGGKSLGPRAAVSAATLAGEKSDEARTVLNSMLDGLRQDGGAFVGAAGMVLDAWSFLLTAYSDGQDALVQGTRDGLDSLPLVGASGLGEWAADKLQSTIKGVGLQPVKLTSLKAVLVNSRHVASKDDSAFSKNYLKVKKRVVKASSKASDLFGMVLTDAELQAVAKVEGLGKSVKIASIELAGEDGPSIPITIPIPQQAKQFGVEAIQNLFSSLRELHAQEGGSKVWK